MSYDTRIDEMNHCVSRQLSMNNTSKKPTRKKSLTANLVQFQNTAEPLDDATHVSRNLISLTQYDLVPIPLASVSTLAQVEEVVLLGSLTSRSLDTDLWTKEEQGGLQ